MKCIYCKEDIRHSSKEEIIPYALGGRYHNKEIVCKSCNNTLGHKVDGKLVDWPIFVLVRNLFLFEGHGGHIPRFEVRDEKGNVYVAEPGWELRPKDVPPEIIFEFDNQVIFRGKTSTEANACKQIERIKHRKIRDLRRKGIRHVNIKTSVQINRKIVRPFCFKPQEYEFSIDEHGRGIAKIAFEFLATKLPREYILSPDFDPIRKFIWDGPGPHSSLWLLADYRDIYTIREAKQLLFHRVTVYCNKQTSNAIGLVELFECVRIAVVLSWQYEGPTQAHCLIEYPLEGNREEYQLGSFNPVLTNMITQLSPQEEQSSQEEFQRNVQALADKLTDHHTRSQIRQVISEYFDDPSLLTVDSIDILLPKIVSYYAFRSNYAGLASIAKQYSEFFWKTILEVTAEKTGFAPAFNNDDHKQLQMLQRLTGIQYILELLVERINTLAQKTRTD